MTSTEAAIPRRATPTDDAGHPPPRYAWYVVGVLTFVYVFSFLDRQILNLLVAPVRRDLHISDTQMSLLIGFAFALFYASFAIPIGRIADSRSRKVLIMVGFAAWSVFTMACGLVSNYSQLLVMRMGVGVGEASLSPAAYSLITDYFPPHRRGRAQGVYSMGIYLGSGIAFILGGFITGLVSSRPEYALPLLGSVRSWQVVFLVIGAAGLLVVPLMLTVKEPPRQGVAGASSSVSLRDVVGYMTRHRRAYVCHNLGIALLMFSAYGTSAWIPTYFIRHFHWTAADIGVVYGSVAAVFGCLGVLGGGWLADRMVAHGHRDAYFRAAFWICVLWFPTGIAYLLVPNARAAVALLAPTMALAAAAFSVGPAALMQLTPSPIRGQAGAIYLFVGNLIGLGIGPTAVALCTDFLFKDDNLVGYSLLIVTCTAHALAAPLLWYGREPYVRCVEAAKVWVGEASPA